MEEIKDTECSSLKTYKLNIEKIDDEGNKVNDAHITLYHYSGWHDHDVPYTEDEMQGVNIFMKALVHFYAQNNSRKAIMHCR